MKVIQKFNKRNLKLLLQNVETIAVVGASSNPERDSYKVMKFLIDYGYKVFPVNPKENDILGRKCYSNLKAIKKKIDMVDIFRANEFIYCLAQEAIYINANIIWTQEGIVHGKAALLGEKNGLQVVMDECPKKILNS